jgi:predicted DCC family thiol-disulfide oxidoreductase YuxK
MRALTVLYDSHCELCCRIRNWLGSQPTYVELIFIAAGSEEARRRFPHLDHERALKELTVISDLGAVYRDAKAWLICLWAMREYREWSLQLGSPELMPLARRTIAWVSRNRFKFANLQGRWRKHS